MLTYRQKLDSNEHLTKINYIPGEYVWVSKRRSVHTNKKGETTVYIEDLEAYPWAICDKVLGRVIFDHPRYVTVEILPHYNPDGGYGLSIPYRTAIHKNDIYNQRFKVKHIDDVYKEEIC